MKRRVQIAICVWAIGGLPCLACGDEPAALLVQPESVRLDAGSPRQQLIVSAGADDTAVDLTRAATFVSETPGVVAVDAAGIVRPVAAGTGSVTVTANGISTQVPVEIGSLDAQPVDFERDIQPILTRFGCNSGACHGKQRGQNGFQLSLLGFDSDFDHNAIAKEARGRRLARSAPASSLFLQKPAGILPHGGGLRIPRDGDEYRLLLRWIDAGAPRNVPDVPQLQRVSVAPTRRSLHPAEQQQLIVTAHYSDGTKRDVTALATYQSNDSVTAAVDDRGHVTAGTVVGEVAVMARYLGQFALCQVALPLEGDVSPDEYAQLPRYNFIDEHVWTTLARLKLLPSPPAPEHRFLRRAYIDIIGRVPTVAEARAYLADTSDDRRANLVDHLLQQPEYAEHWANKWADLLRPNPYRVGIKNTLNYDAWIREQFRSNRPYDQFVRDLLTAQGGTFRTGSVNLFRDRREPDELTTIVSQLFLGVRLECAKCHHHPFEVYGQDDFYSFAAYFAKLGRKGTGLSPPISGSEEYVFTAADGAVQHPVTGAVMEPRPLFGTAPEIKEGTDPRTAIAAWITSRDNPYFARTMANRVWADLMGIGLVEPVDDLRATNPPTNAPLLAALGDDFAAHGFDLKHLIRTIATSYVYGLSSTPVERNVVDTRNYSRHYRRRLRAETLLDSVCQITGVPEDFDAMPAGSSSREIWTHRVESLFLDSFGRPDPNQDPPCERITEPTVVQVLHLMNSEGVYQKVANDNGTAARLAGSELAPAQIVEELYLSVYSRLPDKEELNIGTGLYDTEGKQRRAATEDLLWSLLNTPEFVFKD
ncbi:MAG: DUF1553 domain-containing protein [Planctomycetaceae bacterium]